MTIELTHTALDRAVPYRTPEPRCYKQCDRGSQYCATTYQRAVLAFGIRPSMSRKGDRHDKAGLETVRGSLKQESAFPVGFAPASRPRQLSRITSRLFTTESAAIRLYATSPWRFCQDSIANVRPPQPRMRTLSWSLNTLVVSMAADRCWPYAGLTPSGSRP